MSCIFKIKEASASFTNTEKRIADYCLEHRDETVLESAQVLGELTKTSAAAWIRFSQKLGYKGLTAMKVDLAKDDDTIIEPFDVLIDQKDNMETLIRKAQQISYQTATQTYKLINPSTLKKAVTSLLESRNIYLCGVGASGLVCTDILQKLSRINRNAIYHEDPHVLLARVAHIQKEDTMIAVSYSGESELVNAAVRQAKQMGTCVIAITQFNLKSTLSKLADIALYTPVQEKELRLGAIASRNASLILSDLLYYGVAKENLEQTKKDLVCTRKLIHDVK